jgi:RIO kinase 1
VGRISITKLEEKDMEIPKKLERRKKDADHKKTYDEVFDQATLLLITKLISNKVLSTVDYPISSGKEANIFKGTQPDGTPVALKIYRLATSTFKNIVRYIDGDRRFKNVRRDHRSIIYAWAKKEFKNLQRMSDANIRVPKPITYLKNILIMEFISADEFAAPELRMVKINKPATRFKNILEQIKVLYSTAGLVHGDVSEYNILVSTDELVIIDVGQAVLYDHPMAKDLLVHDIHNLGNYFKRTYRIKLDLDKLTTEILALREDE